MLLAVAVAVIWGLGFVVAKAAMSHFPPILLMALRFALAAACLVWFYRPPRAMLKALLAVALVSATVQYSLTFTGLSGLDVSTAALLLQLEVPLALLLAWVVFGDRIGWRQFAGIALAFVGIVTLIGEPRLSASIIHVLLVLGGALAWASGQIMVKRLGQVGGLALIAWVATLSTPQLLIASLLLESGQWAALASASKEVWAAVAYLGLVMTALGYALWYHLLGRYPVSQCMPFLLLLPLTSVAGGVFFLGERLSVKIIIGGACILAGVAIINLWRAPANAPDATDAPNAR